MAGMRPMLFGIAVILVSGFLRVDGAIHGAFLPVLGMLVGLGVCFVGLLYGIPPANGR